MAFLGVFTHHTGITNLGHSSVSIFFLLSGFLLVYTNFSKKFSNTFLNNLRYMWKKIKGLYPIYVISLLVLLPDLLFFDKSSIIVKIIRFVINLFLFESYFPSDGGFLENISATINGPTWYFSTLTFLYFSFPWILSKIQKFKNNRQAVFEIIKSLVILVVIAYTEFYLEKNTYYKGTWLVYMSPIGRIWDFYIGCNLGYIFLNSNLQVKKISASIAEILSIVVILVLVYFRFNSSSIISSEYLLDIAYIGPSMLFVFIFAIGKGIVTSLLSNSLTQYLSRISGIGFIIHYPIISYTNFSLKLFLHESPSVLLLSSISFIIMIIVIQIYLLLVRYFEHNFSKTIGRIIN